MEFHEKHLPTKKLDSLDYLLLDVRIIEKTTEPSETLIVEDTSVLEEKITEEKNENSVSKRYTVILAVKKSFSNYQVYQPF